jgi:diacylglycerol kinase (CTP)
MNNTTELSTRGDLHILRKIWHIICGASALLIYYYGNQELIFWGKFALVAAAMGFAVDLLRMRFSKFNHVILKFMGPLMRKSEATGFSGLPFYALGVGLTILFYDKHVALLSIMFLVFADPIASFVGVNYGHDKILPNKSLQGSLAALVVCYLVTFIYLSELGVSAFNIILFSFLAAIIGALSELASAFNIDDNLTIPVVSGAGITVINYFFNIL